MKVNSSLIDYLNIIKNLFFPSDKWMHYCDIEKIMCVENEIFRRTNRKPSSIGDATIKASVLQGFEKEHIIQRVLFCEYCLKRIDV
jgi:hypothetical protein